MTEQELLDLKETILDAEKKKDKLDGNVEYLMKTLKEKYKITDLKGADKNLKTMKEEIDALNEEIKTGTEELENKYS